MKYPIWGLIFGTLIVATTGVGYKYLHGAKEDLEKSFRTAKAKRGDISQIVNSTGTIQPIHSVKIGSFVSGPICQINVDFNDRVKVGEVLAKVDPKTYIAQRDSAKAQLDRATADLQQGEAKRDQATQEWRRAEYLSENHAISETDHDTAKANFEVAKANVAIYQAAIQQSKASLALAEANLDYTTIYSPVDGIITDRKVDSGQTLASQFQTPELFVVAPDLDKKVNVLASVDEADIGLIREAQSRNAPVTFHVDAYPDTEFKGTISQVRLTPTTVQNVVTYTVVVEAPNEELKLLPGMTANLSFEIAQHKDVLKIPNAALRFFPKVDQVRAADRSIVEGDSDSNKKNNEKDKEDDAKTASEEEKPSEKPSKPKKSKYVWIIDGDKLSAVKITLGLTDQSFTEMLSGDLQEGQALVTGQKTP